MEKQDTKNQDRAAFACVDSQGQYIQAGLTKREYIAAQVMASLAETYTPSLASRAEISVKHADALLKALEE